MVLSFTVLSGGAFAIDPFITTLMIVDNDLFISQVAGNGLFGGTATLTAKLANTGFPLSGKTVSFSLNGTTVGQATTDANGVATLTNVSLAGSIRGLTRTPSGSALPVMRALPAMAARAR